MLEIDRQSDARVHDTGVTTGVTVKRRRLVPRGIRWRVLSCQRVDTTPCSPVFFLAVYACEWSRVLAVCWV
jgi:hypothetical protein